MKINNEIEKQELNYIFNNPYFKINKYLLIFTGLWPYQHWLSKLLLRATLFFTILPAMFPLVDSCRKWCRIDLDICNENISSILILSSILFKFSVTICSEKKLIIIYQEIARHWYQIKNPKELEILIHYAKIGKHKTIVYLVSLMFGGVMFSQVSMIPKILDIVLPLNASRPKIPILKWQNEFDLEKYFYIFYFWFLIGGVIIASSVVAVDTIFTTAVHQFLGLLSIVKFRLHAATMFSSIENHDLILGAIHLHKAALQLICLMESSYSIVFLYLMISTILFIGLQSFTFLENSRHIADLLRILGMLFIVVIHVLYMALNGQKIIDYSTDLFTVTYMTRWYNMSQNSKILMRIIMMRCLKPCKLTAGKLYIMNIQNFGTIIRKSISCLAVLNSISN